MKYSGKDIFTGKVINGKHEVRPNVEQAVEQIKKLMLENGIEKIEI